jgi:hypothetical protein
VGAGSQSSLLDREQRGSPVPDWPFFGIAGLFRAMPLKRAAAVTGMRATICFVLVVIWFAWA